MDFGLAKLIKENVPLATLTFGMVGTPYYMAPEQISEKEIDERTDIYAFGVMLYEMFAREMPFRGSAVSEIIVEKLQPQIKEPSYVNPDIPKKPRVSYTKMYES